MSTEMFNATVFVSEQLNRLIVNAAQELANRVVVECGSRYNFDSEEAIRLLGLNYIKLERKSTGKTVEKSTPKAKVMVAKPAFPLPYNGEFNDIYCYALRQNNGLYTQCQIARKGDKHFCKSCQALADKNEGTPEYGVIQSRQATGIFEYVDPKGRKPVAYTKVMKKYKVTSEQVLEEAGKFNIIIDSNHFIIPEEDVKRGRPKAAEKTPKEPKGAKGRPKKTKKVLQIEGDEEDLFAALVADANEEDEEIELAPKKKGKSEEEKEAERIAKETEKAEKAAKLAIEKAEKELKLAAEKAEKEAKKETERLAREAKKAEEEAAKLAKKEALEQAKKDKEAKLLEAKTKKSSKKAAEPVEDDEEPVKVKKIEFEGKKYLKSVKTGIIYDLNEFVKNQEQVVVGQWNEAKNKIDFSSAADEESEDEYD
jgi:hypothetical protein